MKGFISGYKFLCEIIATISVNPIRKEKMLHHSKELSPMGKDDARELQMDFMKLAHEIKKQRLQHWRKLDDLLQNCFGISSSNFFAEAEKITGNQCSKSIDSMFKSLFCIQTGTSNLNFAGVAMTIALATGHMGNPKFFIGENEARTVLRKSMESIGYNNADFIPDACFDMVDGVMPEETIQLLFVSLIGALKVKYPHKKNDSQCIRNKEKAREAVESLISVNGSSVAMHAVHFSNEISKICRGLLDAQKEFAEFENFPNGISLALESFYEIPTLKNVNKGTQKTLNIDPNSKIRTIIMGKSGSGKSLLVNAIIRICMDSAAIESCFSQKRAEQLGIAHVSCTPLRLNCSALNKDAFNDSSNLDLIQEAVNQLVCVTRASAHAACLEHWKELESYVIDYFKRKAKASNLLLIIEDASCLDRESEEALMKRICDMENTECANLHILITTKDLNKLRGMYIKQYDVVEIMQLELPLDEEIRKLVSKGVGELSAEKYLSILNSDMRVRRFVDCHENLISFLCYPQEEPFDFNKLLQRTIDERIEEYTNSYVTYVECKEFLTALAVGIAERRLCRGFEYRFAELSYRDIPQELVDRQFLESLSEQIDHPIIIKQHVIDNLILLCPNGNTNHYAFENPMFYYYLIADNYLQLFATQSSPNWLEKFNNMSAEDFSMIILMLVKRLCEYPLHMKGTALQEYNSGMRLLLQSIIGYVAGLNTAPELFECLSALKEITSDEQIKHNAERRVWSMLEQAYSIAYENYVQLSEGLSKSLNA